MIISADSVSGYWPSRDRSPLADLQAVLERELILFTSRASLAERLSKFDFSWFVPAIVKYRKLLGEVLLVSSCCNFSH